uniref:Uncharacterized protein n=1 Tax=Arundo donax TaxID=35708 RepID=A0A0A8ZUD0_ARUDO
MLLVTSSLGCFRTFWCCAEAY